jgi:hypothetical protein
MQLSIGQAEWFVCGSPKRKGTGRGFSLLRSLGIKATDYTVVNEVAISKEDKAAAKVALDRLVKHAKVDGREFKPSEWRVSSMERAAAYKRILASKPWPKGCGKSLDGIRRKSWGGHAKLAAHMNELFPGAGFTAPELEPSATDSGGMDAEDDNTSTTAMQQTPTPTPTPAPVVIQAPVPEINWEERILAVHQLLQGGAITQEQADATIQSLLNKLAGN